MPDERRHNQWLNIETEFGPLVWQTVFRLLRTHADALDCYQDVMLEAFERSGSNAKPVENWPAYLKWLSVRRGLDRLRRAGRTSEQIDRGHDVADLAADCPPERPVELTELKERLRRELTSLPERQATAFWLRFIEQMSYEEISEQLNVDASAAGVLIHRARIRVQKALADPNPFTPETADSIKANR